MMSIVHPLLHSFRIVSDKMNSYRTKNSKIKGAQLIRNVKRGHKASTSEPAEVKSTVRLDKFEILKKNLEEKFSKSQQPFAHFENRMSSIHCKTGACKITCEGCR